MEPRVPAGAWDDAVAVRAARELDPAGIGRLVAVSAHPDDETLGAAGLLRRITAAGGQVELVLATDGEAALPEVGSMDRAALARTRIGELHAALAELGVDAEVHRLGLPDSRLSDPASSGSGPSGSDGGEQALVAALTPLLAGADAWVSPWRADPHPDHAAIGRACIAAAPVTAHGFGFPVWARTRISPDDPAVPWDRAFGLALGPDDRTAKRCAIAAHASQTSVPAGGDRPVLSAATLDHFHGDREVYFREPPRDGAPTAVFAELYSDGADPWEVRTSWYERRKRDVLLASLPRADYRVGAEPGCGLGALTRDLVGRCGRLVATDATAAAIHATTAAVEADSKVEVARADIDDERALPEGIDLAVLSEVLYYLPEERVDAVLERVARALVPGGDLVLVHWRGWPAEAPTDGAAVHRRVLGDDRFDTLVEHVDEDFLLHVVRRR